MILWAKVGGILGAVVLVFLLGYHFGGMAPKLSNATAEIKQAMAHDKETAADESIVAQEAKSYEDASLAPIAAPVVRMCEYAAARAPLPGPHPAGPRTDAPAATVSAAAVPAQPGPDIGPGLVRAAAVAEAQVKGLQDYVSRVCQGGEKAP